jgi:hypothetical protein
MKIHEILLERIPSDEVQKLNVMSFYLTAPPVSSRRIVYDRNGSGCEFYNSYDMVSSISFYKKVSLLPTKNDTV